MASYTHVMFHVFFSYPFGLFFSLSLISLFLLNVDWIRAIGRAIVISRTKSWQHEEEDGDK